MSPEERRQFEDMKKQLAENTRSVSSMGKILESLLFNLRQIIPSATGYYSAQGSTFMIRFPNLTANTAGPNIGAALSIVNGDLKIWKNGAWVTIVGGITSSTFAAYAAGTAYSLTATPALLDFGTTDPSITLTTAGTYLLFARARIDDNGATFAASRTVTLKIRRTNNTAADIANATTSFQTGVITTLTATAGSFLIPVTVYTTANTNDILQLFGSVSVVPSAGSIDAVEAELVAVRIA